MLFAIETKCHCLVYCHDNQGQGSSTWEGDNHILRMKWSGSKVFVLVTPWQLGLTCWCPVMHLCIHKLGHHWFKEELLAKSHYLNQCWLREQISVTFQSKYIHFYKRKWLKNVVYKTADILSWFRYVNNLALILQLWIVPCFVGQCHVCEYPGCWFNL